MIKIRKIINNKEVEKKGSFYIRMSYFGYTDITLDIVGYLNILVLKRAIFNSKLVSIPLEFKSYKKAIAYANKKNDSTRKYNAVGSYHVESIEDDFIKQWVDKRKSYEIKDGKIVFVNGYTK
jgi:hypothetical protein